MAIALATTLIPLGTLLVVAPCRPAASPAHDARRAFIRVVDAVWRTAERLAWEVSLQKHCEAENK